MPDEIACEAGADDGAPPGGVGRELVCGDAKLLNDDGLVLSFLRGGVVLDPGRSPAGRVGGLSPGNGICLALDIQSGKSDRNEVSSRNTHVESTEIERGDS